MKRMMAILVLSLPGMLGTCGTGIWDLQGGTGDPCQVLADFSTRVGKPYPPFKFSQQALRALTARINQKTRLKGKLQIFASAQGAFSAAGRHEVATLVFQETQASHAENYGRTFFVIDGGGPLKLIDLGHGGYDSISNTIRMPDGTDALFISNSYMAQGEVGVYGKLVSLAGPHAGHEGFPLRRDRHVRGHGRGGRGRDPCLEDPLSIQERKNPVPA